MEFRDFGKIARWSRNIIITEKIDGTNSCILIGENGEFLTGSRNRWITPENDNYGFSKWAHANKEDLLSLGVGQHFGEWWGCLSSETSVTLADGSIEKIGKIVNNKLDVEVLSFNFDTLRIEAKRVVGWKRADKTDDWLTVRVKRKWRGGREIGLHLTPNHVCYRQSDLGLPEEVRAEDLCVGDFLYMNAETPGYLQEQVMRGSILGDASISDYSFSCGHSNEAYTASKVRILCNLITRESTTTSGHGSTMHNLHTKSLPLLRDIQEECYCDGVKRLPVEYIKRLHPCGLAFWYMDDGCLQTSDSRSEVCTIHTNGFTDEDVSAVSRHFNSVGYQNYVVYCDGMPVLKFTPTGTVAFHATIAPYVTSEMTYKLISRYRSIPRVWESDVLITDETTSLAKSEIVSIDDTYVRGSRSRYRYDIEVEDNHNFFANNLLVHNSGIQRKYNQDRKRFSLFNTSKWTDIRPECCDVVPVLYSGILSDQAIIDAVESLRTYGSVAAPGFCFPEGIIIWHEAARHYFKKTLNKDDVPKILISKEN